MNTDKSIILYTLSSTEFNIINIAQINLIKQEKQL